MTGGAWGDYQDYLNGQFDSQNHMDQAQTDALGNPMAYETELQVVINALGDMKQKNVSWEDAGTQNVGILVSDTMMFERAEPFPSDPGLGSFYGHALPIFGARQESPKAPKTNREQTADTGRIYDGNAMSEAVEWSMCGSHQWST